ncbi:MULTISPECIES: MFS transporter [unclassified Rhizobium]|uniref:MFS transporter n=1 Tax=unclassified Rhizobium TaxID=2613769 RepID=UPI001ADCC04A|nr:MULTISPECIES: MFS transporter [unclassified Rhizobium]MBO9123764.1 MFS transporter [Rhizobium sp. 16-488-2b]MBO9174296.1 MFS transporter [Rhizobium sp. 16-488-2a]
MDTRVITRERDLGARVEDQSHSTRLPLAIYMFALSAFALGLAEFVPIGLSEVIARSLMVSGESVGAIVSIYALGATIAAPILSALTAAWSRKNVMIITAVIFSAGSLFAALSSDLPTMVVARFFAGVGHGLFLAVATSVATKIAGPQRAGSSVAIVFGGFTLALALGVPLGTWLGKFVSWRPMFLGIAGFGFLGLIGLMFTMKADSKVTDANSVDAALRGLRALFHPRLLAGVLVTVLAYVGSFGVFTYIAPMLIQVTGAAPTTVSAFMLIYGVMAAIGNVVGGKLTDRLGADRASLIVVAGIAATAVAMYFMSTVLLAMALLTAVLGLLTFGAVPPLQARLLAVAETYTPQSVGVAAGLNIAGFNSGIVFGSALGGVAMGAFGVASTSLVGATAAILGIIVLAAQLKR